MKRQARCWICGTLFEAERGSLPRGARFCCESCVADGLQGSPDRATLSRALHERHGVPYLDLAGLSIEPDVLRLVPEDFARHHAVIPVMLKPESGSARKGSKKAAADRPRAVSLVLAMASPENRFAIEAIRRRIGIPVQRFVTTWAEVSEAIAEHYLPIALADEPASDS